MTLSTMNINYLTSARQTHHTQRMHLWRQLQRRIHAAQDNPSLLALLAKEAHDLAFDFTQMQGVEPQPSRVDRTLSAISSLKVEHS